MGDKWLWLGFGVFFALVADLGSKFLMIGQTITAAPDSFLFLWGDQLVLHLEQRGNAFFGFLPGGPLTAHLLAGFAFLSPVLLLAVTWRQTNRSYLFGLALLAGAGLAAWVDILLHGGSLVFIRPVFFTHWTGLPWPPFNLADVLRVLGASLAVLAWFGGKSTRPASRASAETTESA